MPTPASQRDTAGFSVVATTRSPRILRHFAASIAIVASSLASPRALSACECGMGVAETAPSSPTLAHDAVAGDEPHALGSYAAGAAVLRTEALRRGSVTYQQVIEAAYGPGMIDEAMLRRKAEWRATLGDGFVFLADYSQLETGAKVQPLVAIADASLQSTLVAQYESILHVIGISSSASDFAIFHEAGHALQRASLRARGGLSGRRSEGAALILDDSHHTATADQTSVHRLLYLSSQDEFEVRLQDLNRFHARVVGDGPIVAPEQSLRALAALGVPLQYEESREAFALGGLELSPAAFAAAATTDRCTNGPVVQAFEDAREFRLLRRLALRVAPEYWPRLLAKIIFEAPGHL